MTETAKIDSVNIRPKVRVLSVFQHLNYREWFALAEFVDNSIQSYLEHKTELETVEGPHFKLIVEIGFEPQDGGRLTIRDNACGISLQDFPRAFRPAEVPPDTSGLSEFGMGMKSAALWFSPLWSVRTSALGDTIERSVRFDIAKIVDQDLENLNITSKDTSAKSHYTEIVMDRLHHKPQTKTIGKIKEHLASIYRKFLRAGELELRYNGEPLKYTEVGVLYAPRFDQLQDESFSWKKEIEFDFGDDLKAFGFAALRDIGSTAEAGFALFRRGRVIEGSADETYRPKEIFGSQNSFRYQRLFGEIHLEGFSVTYSKDRFQWDDNEQPFLDLLVEELDKEPLPLLKQAERYYYQRRKTTQDIKKGADEATRNVARILESSASVVIERQLERDPLSISDIQQNVGNISLIERKLSFMVSGENWDVRLIVSDEVSESAWVAYREEATIRNARQLCVQLSLSHPFMVQFGGWTAREIEPLQRVAVALVLAEVTARESGVKAASTIRHNVDELLRDVLSKL